MSLFLFHSLSPSVFLCFLEAPVHWPYIMPHLYATDMNVQIAHSESEKLGMKFGAKSGTKLKIHRFDLNKGNAAKEGLLC